MGGFLCVCVYETEDLDSPKQHPMCGLEKGSGGPCAIAVGTRTTLNSHYLEWLKPCFIYQHPT